MGNINFLVKNLVQEVKVIYCILCMKLMELGSECRLLSPTPRLTCLILFPAIFSDFAEILCKKTPYKQGRMKRRIKVFGL